jgi:hypothetical protein
LLSELATGAGGLKVNQVVMASLGLAGKPVQFYYLPIHDTSRLAERLRQRTIGLFLKLDLIRQQFAENPLRGRRRSGRDEA